MTFTEPGSLGLRFTPNPATSGVEVLGVNPGTQATVHAGLVPGLTLVVVGTTLVAGLPHKQVIDTIKASGRPLTCQFSPPSDIKTICVTFTEPGSLGLKFTPNQERRTVDVMGVNVGTQAEQHPQLKPGLTLLSVGSTSVRSMPYKRVIETIKAAGSRPLTCQFSDTTDAKQSESESEEEEEKSPTRLVSSSILPPQLDFQGCF